MTKQQQYYQYLAWGGTMSLEEWEHDGRFDPGAISQAKKEFDPAPLVETITRSLGAEETAAYLDEAMNKLSFYMVSTGDLTGDYYANMLIYLRQLRNAILKGAHIIDFDNPDQGVGPAA